MKKLLSLVLALLMMLSIVPAVAEDDAPITMTAGILYGSHMGDFTKYKIWDYIAEKTGVKIELVVYSSAEQVALMMAGAEYPEILFRTDMKAAAYEEALEFGDFLPLNDLIDQYMPTVKAFLEANPLVKQLSTEADGTMYYLPYVTVDETAVNLRDVWGINKNFLAQLEMEVPKTLDEFTAYLRAVKAAAGTGCIPENVIPYMFRAFSNITGDYDLYASFGVFNGLNGLYVDNGVVKHNWTNPLIKQVIQYEQMLYKEGLITPEVFTADSATATAYFNAADCIVGSMAGFSFNQPHWEYMMPLDTGNGEQPYFRKQTLSIMDNFIITKNCKDPVAAAKLAEFLASDETVMLWSAIGAEGYGYYYNEDGELTRLTASMTNVQEEWRGPANYYFMLRSADFNKGLYTSDLKNPASRVYQFYNVFQPGGFIAPDTLITFPSVPAAFYPEISDDDEAILNQGWSDALTFAKAKISEWIVNGSDVEAEWDAYVAQFESYNTNGYIAHRQAAYDAFTK